jgi:hypothetical protein
VDEHRQNLQNEFRTNPWLGRECLTLHIACKHTRAALLPLMRTFVVIRVSLAYSENMSSDTPDPDYRNYKMPPDDLNRTLLKPKQPDVRVNGKIRAREVRVIGEKGEQIGVMSLTGALALVKAAKLDLVQITSNIDPPICRLADYGKYFYELSKRGKKSD